MIVNCPECRKPMSSKAPACPNCGMERGELSDDQLNELTRRRLRDRVYRLKMSNYAAISVLLAAAGWYFYQSSNLDMMPTRGPLILVSIGAAADVLSRGLLFKAKRDLKRL